MKMARPTGLAVQRARAHLLAGCAGPPAFNSSMRMAAGLRVPAQTARRPLQDLERDLPQYRAATGLMSVCAKIVAFEQSVKP